MKNRSVQDDLDNEDNKDNDKEKGFCQRFRVGMVQQTSVHNNSLKN